MKKWKYVFNPDTLIYEKVEIVFRDVLLRKILPHFALSVILGMVLATLLNRQLDSPHEKNLLLQNQNYKLKYEFLTKRINEMSTALSEIQHRDDEIYRMIFEAEPISAAIRTAGFGGSDRYEELKGYESSDLLVNAAQSLDQISKQLVVQSKSFDEVIALVSEKEQMLSCIPAIQPISNKDMVRFGSPFGMRKHPILNYVGLHTGIDLSAPTGTPVYATGDGVVLRADASSRGYGNHIRVNHGYGYSTLYAHLSKMLVSPGQAVKRGDLIGLVGSTGLSTSSHLHYEVRINNEPVDPVNFYSNDLSDDEYQQMIESNLDTHVFEW